MESGTGGEDSGERAQRSNFGFFPTYCSRPHAPGGGEGNKPLLPQRRLQELAAEVDPHQLLDEDVEELLMQLADDFIESAVTSSCQLARHRKSNTLESKDLQLHLERMWNMSIPGFGVEEQPHRKSASSEAHKQRINLIKKSKR